MSKIEDGGLAFPGTRSEQVGTMADYGIFDDDSPVFGEVSHPGMTLRDWLAGQTLPAIIAATSAGQHQPQMREGEPHIRFAIARDAYDMADAMLAAREGGAS